MFITGKACLAHDGQEIIFTPLLRKFIGLGLVKGQLFLGKWLDVGTIERLNKADR